LEAAYIIPQNHDVANGILLRSDIHTLFDLNLIAIDPDEKIHVHPGLSPTSFYLEYDKKHVQPRHNSFSPSKQALKQRYDEWMNVWVTQIFDLGDLFRM
jgi:predicted restriction endonuclease